MPLTRCPFTEGQLGGQPWDKGSGDNPRTSQSGGKGEGGTEQACPWSLEQREQEYSGGGELI